MNDSSWYMPFMACVIVYYCHGKSKTVIDVKLFYISFPQVKFHVESHHRLRSCGSSSISSLQFLNMEQLTKTLTSLYILYEANRRSNSIYTNEAELRSLYVLLHLDSKSLHTVIFIIHWFCESIPLNPLCWHCWFWTSKLDLQEESLSFWFCRVPSLLMKSKEMHFARKVLRWHWILLDAHHFLTLSLSDVVIY